MTQIQPVLASVGQGYNTALLLRGRETEAPRFVPQVRSHQHLGILMFKYDLGNLCLLTLAKLGTAQVAHAPCGAPATFYHFMQMRSQGRWKAVAHTNERIGEKWHTQIKSPGHLTSPLLGNTTNTTLKIFTLKISSKDLQIKTAASEPYHNPDQHREDLLKKPASWSFGLQGRRG